MWEKFKAQFSAHPYLFGGVAIAILLWIFWPRSSGGTSDAAVQSAAIAQTAQANASLMLAHEDTQKSISLAQEITKQYGIQASSAEAINAQNIAGITTLAGIESATRAYDADSAVKLATIQAGAQSNIMDTILKSQESAQAWASKIEADSGILPGNYETLGFVNSGPAIVKVDPAPVRSNPIYNSPFFGGSEATVDWGGSSQASGSVYGGFNGFGYG